MNTAEIEPGWSARKLASTIAQATKWPLETWVIHPTGDPGCALRQVELYRHSGEWNCWTYSMMFQHDLKRLGLALATKRNAHD